MQRASSFRLLDYFGRLNETILGVIDWVTVDDIWLRVVRKKGCELSLGKSCFSIFLNCHHSSFGILPSGKEKVWRKSLERAECALRIVIGEIVKDSIKWKWFICVWILSKRVHSARSLEWITFIQRIIQRFEITNVLVGFNWIVTHLSWGFSRSSTCH